MARRLSQRHGKPRARLDTASTRSSFFSSSASFLCHLISLHRPLWQFSRFVFRCHGGKPPPARLLAYANTPLPPSAGAQSPRPQRPGFTHPLPSLPSLRASISYARFFLAIHIAISDAQRCTDGAFAMPTQKSTKNFHILLRIDAIDGVYSMSNAVHWGLFEREGE